MERAVLEGVTNILTAAAGNPFLVVGVLIVSTFVLEDVATICSALLAAEGVLPIPAVLLGLFLGITIGDIGLYWIGRYASTHPGLRRWIGEERLARGSNWLGSRMVPAMLVARTMPGFRTPCYLACGYLNLPFRTFALVAVVGVAAWSSFAFTVIYFYGLAARAWLGSFSWIAGIVLILLVLSWPHIFRMRRKRAE